MDRLTAFGLLSVTAGLLCYALEKRSRWFILGFALSCAASSLYGFLQGAWPFGVIEIFWTLVAFRRWYATCIHPADPVARLGYGHEAPGSYNQNQ